MADGPTFVWHKINPSTTFLVKITVQKKSQNQHCKEEISAPQKDIMFERLKFHAVFSKYASNHAAITTILTLVSNVAVIAPYSLTILSKENRALLKDLLVSPLPLRKLSLGTPV